MDTDQDPGAPKSYGSDGSGSSTLAYLQVATGSASKEIKNERKMSFCRHVVVKIYIVSKILVKREGIAIK
jgi:hypothetical protein